MIFHTIFLLFFIIFLLGGCVKIESSIDLTDPSAIDISHIVTSKLETAKKNLELANAQKEQQKQYDALISSGDQSLSTSDFQSALENYNKAKDLIPGDKTAYDKIKNLEPIFLFLIWSTIWVTVWLLIGSPVAGE